MATQQNSIRLAHDRKTGRVTPCAPPAALKAPTGAHGVTRPTFAQGFRGSIREGLFRNRIALLE
jgi:hypothetical protein